MAIGGNEVVAQFLGLAVESDRRDNDKHNEKLQNDICVIKNDGSDCLGANALTNGTFWKARTIPTNILRCDLFCFH